MSALILILIVFGIVVLVDESKKAPKAKKNDYILKKDYPVLRSNPKLQYIRTCELLNEIYDKHLEFSAKILTIKELAFFIYCKQELTKFYHEDEPLDKLMNGHANIYKSPQTFLPHRKEKFDVWYYIYNVPEIRLLKNVCKLLNKEFNDENVKYIYANKIYKFIPNVFEEKYFEEWKKKFPNNTLTEKELIYHFKRASILKNIIYCHYLRDGNRDISEDSGMILGELTKEATYSYYEFINQKVRDDILQYYGFPSGYELKILKDGYYGFHSFPDLAFYITRKKMEQEGYNDYWTENDFYNYGVTKIYPNPPQEWIDSLPGETIVDTYKQKIEEVEKEKLKEQRKKEEERAIREKYKWFK